MEGLHHDTILEPSATDSDKKKGDPKLGKRKSPTEPRECRRFFYLLCESIAFG